MRFVYAVIFILTISSSSFSQKTASLSGQVLDQNGALIPGAVVTATSSTDGREQTATTDREGEFVFTGLPVGVYKVRVGAKNFAPYEDANVVITAGNRQQLKITLTISVERQEVTVSNENRVSADPDNNKSAIILRGGDLKALPEDPDELAAALQALAGFSAGPDGGQIYIDGFTGGKLPPRESIREIRVGDNPFSAEIDRVSYGRIEIFTKPGSEKLQGQFFFNFNDEKLNARNPFAANRAASQLKYYGGNLSGSLIKNKLSFFLDFDRRDAEDNSVVNATILDQNLNPVLFNQAVVVPARRFSFSPRLDYAINEKNVLFGRYSFTNIEADNRGIGDFSLPTRAVSTENAEHILQLVETAVLASNIVNETRFQYIRNTNRQAGANKQPTINVAGAFAGGGSGVGFGFTADDRYELQNYTTAIFGKHGLKFGARLRGLSIRDCSETNFNGAFIFAGRSDSGLTSLEQYRQRLLNNPDSRFNPNQFTITVGDPLAKVSQVDFGGFINDDWRVRQNLTLSFGLRYEAQTNVEKNLNLAPRLSFAYAPGNAKQPKTVLRGGFGIFYERVAENLSLQEFRFDGQRQVQYIVTDVPAILSQPVFTLNNVTNVPSPAQIAALAPGNSTMRRLAKDIQSPYMIQGAISVERQFPFSTTLTFTYLATRMLHLLRTRNVNAPVCPNSVVCPAAQSLTRPFPGQGNIYQFESSGRLDQRQLIINFKTRFHPRVTLFGNYRLGSVKSDTDGVNTFPAYSYDLSGEYARSLSDARHFFLMGSSLSLLWNVRFGTYITVASGRPFNITTGVDSNRDSLFTERPTFASDLSRPSVRQTRFGAFDLDPLPGQQIIPRNYGRGPTVFNVNLNASKTFGFGGGKSQSGAQNNQRKDDPYNLTLGVQIFNLFNRNNAAAPIGNLSSPRFGESNAIASFGFFNAGGSGGGSTSGNRRITLQARFSF